MFYTYLFNSLFHVFCPREAWVWPFYSSQVVYSLGETTLARVWWFNGHTPVNFPLQSSLLLGRATYMNGWSQLNMREVKVDKMSNASPRPQVPIQHMKMQMGRVTACMWKREAKGNKSSCRNAVHNNPRIEITMKRMKEHKSEQGSPQASLGLCPLLRSCFAGMKKWSKPMAFLQHLGHPGILGFSKTTGHMKYHVKITSESQGQLHG